MVTFLALGKKFSKKQLVSLDSEVEITLRTGDASIIPGLNDLFKADEEIVVIIAKQNEVKTQ